MSTQAVQANGKAKLEAVKPATAEGKAITQAKTVTEVKPKTLEFHEAANIFPLLEGEEFQNLVKDIKENGQREPIITYQGKILDGRNRYRACLEAGKDPIFQEWDGKGSPTTFVVSLNFHRRHLTTDQKTKVAIEIEKLLKEEAKMNMVKGGKGEAVTKNINARKEAAKLAGVSEGSIAARKQVEKNGSEKLKEAVDKGEIKVSTAAELTKISKEEQDKILEKGKAEVIKKAKEIKDNKAKTKVEDKPQELEIVDPEELKLGIFKALKEIDNFTKDSSDVELLRKVFNALEVIRGQVKK